MHERARFALRAGVLFLGGIGVPAATAAALLAALSPEERQLVLEILSRRFALLVFGAFALLALSLALARWLQGAYIDPARALAARVRATLSVDDGVRIASDGAPELAQLATAIDRLVDDRRRLRQNLDARVRESQVRLEEERNRLAALMSELSEGVMVSNAEGRVLLYNARARLLFAGEESAAPAAPVGLGRSVFTLIGREQFAHAREKLERALERGDAAPVTSFVAPAGAGRIARFNAAPYRGADAGVAGIVFTFSDVTAMIERESRRLAILQGLAAGIRAPAANIRAAAESLARYPEMEAERRRRFMEILTTESETLSRSIHDALNAYGEALKAGLALEEMRAADLLAVARRAIGAMQGLTTVLDAVDEELWLNVDSFALVQSFCHLARKLRDDYGVRTLHLAARARGALAELDLAWDGAIVAHDALALWEGEPMGAGAERTPLTVRDVLERHGGEAWLQAEGPAGQRVASVRFLLPATEPSAPRASAPEDLPGRPEYYDFDLFAQRASADLKANRLADIAYTVFDTETTGLEPSAGDEIISIGAVRIVNGRLLKNELFECLVDPRRPLDPASARIHGIDAGALAGQPVIEQVLPAFHRFCEDTVLVAHNAAFDMRFLELKESAAGVRFAQPVLDTLLLSAVVSPELEDHRLEAIAERLGVPLIGRHTAVGDALVAAEVFLRLLKLLAGQGIETLGQALEASRQTYYARLQY
jgi:DNA polymerase-3 subunit epsilon